MSNELLITALNVFFFFIIYTSTFVYTVHCDIVY